MRLSNSMGWGAVALCGIAITYSCAARAPVGEAELAPRTIAVSGTADVHVVPDEVVLTFGVESFDRDLSRARKDNASASSRVLEVARGAGVEERHLHTDHISVRPRYDHYDPGKLQGYEVQQTIIVSLQDLEHFEAVLTGSLEAGANHVHRVEFRTSELRTHKDEARELAVQAAREKAAAMAAELGQEVGEPLEVAEQPTDWWSGYGSWWGWGGRSYTLANCSMEAPGSAGEGTGSVAPGQITITGSVQVRFELL